MQEKTLQDYIDEAEAKSDLQNSLIEKAVTLHGRDFAFSAVAGMAFALLTSEQLVQLNEIAQKWIDEKKEGVA